MIRAILCVLAVLLHASTASAQWVRVESPHFVVFGEIGEKRTRDYAGEFERFREALGRVMPGAAARPAVPTVVFIFKDARSFAPHRPLFNGKPVEVSGYFAGGPSLDVIMMPATSREQALRTIYHEYSHLVTANAARGLPVWLSEGLAEYYSTFEVRDDGRRALLGGIIPSHLSRLNSERTLSLGELVSVGHDSPLYNEGARRSMFYAQSWALVHMLLNGEPNRRPQFDNYVRLTHAGRSPAEAWTEAFGDEKDARIEEHLRRYVRQAQVTGYLFTFDQPINPAAFTVSTPAPADVEGALADLRAHVSPESRVADEPLPPSPYGSVVQGLALVAAERPADALPLLVKVAQTADDWLVRYRAAVGLERIATTGDDEMHREAARAADAALIEVLKARPQLAHALALRGLVAGPGDAGVDLLRQARALAPSRAHYAIWLAQFHSSRGEFEEARALLAPLLSPWVPVEIREYARSALGAAVSHQQVRERTVARGEAGDAPPPPPGTVIPLFREVLPGETRVEAVFERVECPREGIILHVRVGERTLRYTAPSFDDIEFLTYRDVPPAPISCGPRTPADRVYLTWRAGAGPHALDGIVVAVELLPR
jgi:hypothetical protein